MRRAAGLVATLTAVGLALVACGGSARMSKAAYEKALNSSLARMQREVKAAYGPLVPRPSSSPTRCSQTGTEVVCSGDSGSATLTRAGRLRAGRRVQTAFDRAATELVALNPPADVAADNEKLVAGLRAVAKLESIYLSARGVKQAEVRANAILHSADFRGLDAAAGDLTKKGYKVETLANSGSPRLTGPSTPSPPVAKAIKPLPFAIVSRAGKQVASDLTATICAAKSTSAPSPSQGQVFSSCGVFSSSEAPTGPIPTGLSVVRPGERIQFVGPAFAHVHTAGVPFASGWVDKLCAGFGLPVKGFFLDGRSWAVKLKPGAYILSLSVSWAAAQGTAAESGIVGVLVSRTQPLRVLPRPRCQ